MLIYARLQRLFNVVRPQYEKHCNVLKLREKKTTRYYEQDPQKVKEYLEKIKDISKEKIVYIDETGIDKFMYREYVRAPEGKKVYGRIEGNKFEITNIVTAQTKNKILAPQLLQ